MCLLLNHRETFRVAETFSSLERLVAPVRPQIFFSRTIEKFGRTLEPCFYINIKCKNTIHFCTYPEWAKGLAKSLWTPHIQHTPSLNCYRLVDATELWAPERPGTGTVSSLRQFISWTLDNNVEHTTLLYIIYSSHILIYISNWHISYLYMHNCLYYILCFCFFWTLPILYICILLFLLSLSCPVAVFLLHCGASVTITNSSCV